jgi:hypothetical protein
LSLLIQGPTLAPLARALRLDKASSSQAAGS